MVESPDGLLRLAVMLSGRGSNLAAIQEAISDGVLRAEIVAVISNRPDAPGLTRAREWQLPAHAIDHKAHPSRSAHENAVAAVLDSSPHDFIVLAGYMRLLSSAFVARFRNRILNIHPSLLPAFPGAGAQAQAVAYGVKVAGCTVHFVDENLDAGPIILQRAIPVSDTDDADSLAARILEQEHLAYVEALRKLQGGGWRIDGRRVIFP